MGLRYKVFTARMRFSFKFLYAPQGTLHRQRKTRKPKKKIRRCLDVCCVMHRRVEKHVKIMRFSHFTTILLFFKDTLDGSSGQIKLLTSTCVCDILVSHRLSFDYTLGVFTRHYFTPYQCRKSACSTWSNIT